MRRGVRLTRLKLVRRPSGRAYLYYRRRDGGLTPLPSLPESHPDFLAAYAEAARADPPPAARPAAHPRALGALADRYLDSREFARLAEATRGPRRRLIAQITAGARGDAPVTGLAARHVEADLRGVAPGVARNRLKAWRALMRHAIALGWIAADPSAGVRAPAARSRPHPAWSPAAVAAFRARWPLGSQQRAALEIAYAHAPRRADLAALNRRDVAGRMISWRQSKTGARVTPRALAPAACAAIDALVAARPGISTLLETQAGRPRSVKALGEWFREACAAAGIAGLSLHGLRHTLASDAAEGGATELAIQQLLGHATPAEARVYTQQARAARLAEAGAAAAERSRNAGNPRGPALETGN